ncbi:MAG: hypothetical protein NT062_26215, partial [Proteobacteria bacterium]|nr:hypothetical protein [Pseudomonadota bacterium]
MSRSTLVGVVLALVGSVGPLAGCKKAGDAADAGGAPAVVKRGGDAANALWALAPDKLIGGIVA